MTMQRAFTRLYGIGIAIALASPIAYAYDEKVDFDSSVQPILTKYCAGCHNQDDSEADVMLHDWKSVAAGTPKTKLFVASDPDNSLLLKLMTGSAEPKMPPDDEPQPTKEEIETIRRWIAQGAHGSNQARPLKSRVAVPHLESRFDGKMPITALAAISNDRWLVGMQERVALKEANWTSNVPIEFIGKVAQIRVSHDSKSAVVASGIPGVGGQATILSIERNGVRVRKRIEGHRDSLYTAVLSPNGKLLATGGYDRVIHLWDAQRGILIRSLIGHNGAIYDLDFDPTGVVIASASADETIKIWNVETGERLDTLGQCEAEQYVVRFDASGQRVMAAGADKRIRVWRVESKEKPSVSPMLFATFAHEGSVLSMASSPDNTLLATVGEDRTIKLWSQKDITPYGVLDQTDDVPTGVVWLGNHLLAVSTMKGTTSVVSVKKQIDAPQSDSSTHNQHWVEASESQELSQIAESSESRTSKTAQLIPAFCTVSGSITEMDSRSSEPGDWYAFDAKQGDTWLLSIDAARSGSKLDSTLDVTDLAARPVLRTRLQALRESYFTFRGKDSKISDDFRLHRWEDMELNEMLYAGGEVVKLWLYPRGPDSGFRVYPGSGNRQTYFDTTATTHALNEPAWIVRELLPDEPPVSNGLPVFPIYFSNDDGADRTTDTDSQLMFTAPSDGRFLIRVRDSRGGFGEKYTYKLTINRPNPRFTVKFDQKDLTLRAGVGNEFSITAVRREGLQGEIELIPEGLPDGLVMTQPLSIQSDQIQAVGTIYVPKDKAESLPKEFTLTVQSRSKTPGGNSIAAPPITLAVKVSNKTAMMLKVVQENAADDAEPTDEIVVRAGTTAKAKLVIQRGELKGDISFGKEESGRNLPHGVFVDNIGLSGLLIPEGESKRYVFITAAPWVPAQTRLFHLKAEVDGKPTTVPIQIHVVRE